MTFKNALLKKGMSRDPQMTLEKIKAYLRKRGYEELRTDLPTFLLPHNQTVVLNEADRDDEDEGEDRTFVVFDDEGEEITSGVTYAQLIVYITENFGDN
jgi:hypothetical protein